MKQAVWHGAGCERVLAEAGHGAWVQPSGGLGAGLRWAQAEVAVCRLLWCCVVRGRSAGAALPSGVVFAVPGQSEPPRVSAIKLWCAAKGWPRRALLPPPRAGEGQ